jgi:hypothetical protein
VIANWTTLLRSAGLDAIAQAPILDQQRSANIQSR